MEERIQEGILSEQLTPGDFNPLSDEILEYIFNSSNGFFMNRQQCNDKKGTEAFNRLRKSLAVLSLPPKFTTVRVNLHKISLEDAILAIEDHMNDQIQQKSMDRPKSVIYPHPVIPDLIVIESNGYRNISPKTKEVIVGRLCGSAVLRGAEVFAPGVLGATPGLCVGEEVAVYADFDDKCLRGSKVYNGRKLFVGNGRALQGRLDLFRVAKPVGVAITMEEKIFDCPSLGDFHSDIFFLQNLPSVLCSHVLWPDKNGVVLDMCAAPGGKTTHLASMVGNSGQVIAIDRSQRKINLIKENSDRFGLTNISAFVYDSTKLVSEDGQPDCKKVKRREGFIDATVVCSAPPYAPNSFRWILVDAPCSALGQRPQIQTKCSTKELKSFPVLQQKLLESAVKLLKPGGKLVYSTCTIILEENEKMVKWVLDNFKDIELIDSQPKVGQSGVINCGLSEDQCKKVQRFFPLITNTKDGNRTIEGHDNDTIGFFIAAFRKLV